MGRGESEDLSAAQIMYPVMQCADIFFLKVGCWGFPYMTASHHVSINQLAVCPGLRI